VSSLDSQILAAFLARVKESGGAGETVVQELDGMLGRDKLPKAEELVRLYEASAEGGGV
jgi:hypothetical protein